MDMKINVVPEIAVEIIVKAVVEKYGASEVVDQYCRSIGEREVIVLTLEKYYMRASRVTLTVTLDNIDEFTTVHIVASGGASGLVKIDWGAAKKFALSVKQALQPYVV